MRDLDPLIRRYGLAQILQHLLSRFSLEEIRDALLASGEQKLREEVYSILGKGLAKNQESHHRYFSDKDLTSAVATLVELREPVENEAYRWLRDDLLKITVSYKKGTNVHEREILCWLKISNHSKMASNLRFTTSVRWDEIPEEARAQFLRGSPCEEFQLFPRRPSSPER